MIDLNKLKSAEITLIDTEGEKLFIPLASIDSCDIIFERELIDITNWPSMSSPPQREFEAVDQTITLNIKGRRQKDEN